MNNQMPDASQRHPTPGDLPDQGSNSCLLQFLHCRRILYHWATREALSYNKCCLLLLLRLVLLLLSNPSSWFFPLTVSGVNILPVPWPKLTCCFFSPLCQTPKLSWFSYKEHILSPSLWLQWLAQRMGTWPKPASRNPSGIFFPKLWKKWSLSAEITWFWSSSNHWYHHVEKAHLKNKPSRERLCWSKLFLKPEVTLDLLGTQMKVSSLLYKLIKLSFYHSKGEDFWQTHDSKLRWYVLFVLFFFSIPTSDLLELVNRVLSAMWVCHCPGQTLFVSHLETVWWGKLKD